MWNFLGLSESVWFFLYDVVFLFVQNTAHVEKSRVKDTHLRGDRFRPYRAGAVGELESRSGT